MTVEEMAALKGLGWAALERKAIEADVSLRKIQEAATRDELRLEIAKAVSPDG